MLAIASTRCVSCTEPTASRASPLPQVVNQFLKQIVLQLPRNHHALNLARPFIDLGNPRMAVVALHRVVLQAFCDFLGQEAVIKLADLLPAPWLAKVELSADSDPAWALAMVCRGIYDPRRDDADFRRSLGGTVQEQKLAFDALRKHYPVRREIEGLQVRIEGESQGLTQMVKALGAVLV